MNNFNQLLQKTLVAESFVFPSCFLTVAWVNVHRILGECVLMCLGIWWGGSSWSCFIMNPPNRTWFVMLGLRETMAMEFKNCRRTSPERTLPHTPFQRESGLPGWSDPPFPTEPRGPPQYPSDTEVSIGHLQPTAPTRRSSMLVKVHALYSVYLDSPGLFLQPHLSPYPPQAHLAMVILLHLSS